MKYRLIIILFTVLVLLARPFTVSALFLLVRPAEMAQNRVLSQVNYSLKNRHVNAYVNGVFSDNILLTVAYMGGSVKNAKNLSWEAVRAQNESKITLNPGQTFAFHDAAFAKYKGQIASTTNVHFSSYEGFKSDGYLVADGVCHLASFMKVAAKEAGLTVEAPVRHDFAAIPEVDKADGVSIYYTPFDKNNSANQNLYITNNKSKTIAFVFNHNNSELNIKVEELN